MVRTKLALWAMALALYSLLSACAVLTGTHDTATVFAERQTDSPLFDSAIKCREQLRSSSKEALPDRAHFGSQLTLASWNAQKSTGEDWKSDLRQLAGMADILLLQEVIIDPEAANILPHSFVAVAEGFRSMAGPSGVVSASYVDPLGSCSFIDKEPLLGTRKASSIAHYPLVNRDTSLLVANIHSVNFSLGLVAFERQLMRLAIVLSQHKGPIIFAGDFNIWNKRRAQLVEQLTDDLGLLEVDFTPDSRKVVFGYPLDRIYSRGLPVVEASTTKLESSDHDALIAVWEINNGISHTQQSQRRANQ